MNSLIRPNYKKINDEWIVYSMKILKYKKIPYNLKSREKYSKKIKEHLTPDLCSKKYRNQNKSNSLFGHCYHAIQTAYYLFDTDVLKIYSATLSNGIKHWWLKDIKNDSILDITANQFDSKTLKTLYDKGKKDHWFGWKGRPHMRTLKLIKRIQEESKIIILDKTTKK